MTSLSETTALLSSSSSSVDKGDVEQGGTITSPQEQSLIPIHGQGGSTTPSSKTSSSHRTNSSDEEDETLFDDALCEIPSDDGDEEQPQVHETHHPPQSNDTTRDPQVSTKQQAHMDEESQLPFAYQDQLTSKNGNLGNGNASRVVGNKDTHGPSSTLAHTRRRPTVQEYFFPPQNPTIQRYYRFRSTPLTPIAALHKRPGKPSNAGGYGSVMMNHPNNQQQAGGVTGLLRRSAVVPSHGTDRSGEWVLVSVGGRSGWAKKKFRESAPYAGFSPADTFSATEAWMGNHAFLCLSLIHI